MGSGQIASMHCCARIETALPVWLPVQRVVVISPLFEVTVHCGGFEHVWRGLDRTVRQFEAVKLQEPYAFLGGQMAALHYSRYESWRRQSPRSTAPWIPWAILAGIRGRHGEPTWAWQIRRAPGKGSIRTPHTDSQCPGSPPGVPGYATARYPSVGANQPTPQRVCCVCET